MQLDSRETAWNVVAIGSAALAGVAARNLLKSSWKQVRHTDPPLNPASRDTAWSEALAWTVAMGVAVGVARLVARRGATAAWERYMGEVPENIHV